MPNSSCIRETKRLDKKKPCGYITQKPDSFIGLFGMIHAMSLDTPLFALTIYTFITLNFFGWEFLHDKRYIAFVLGLVVLYVIARSSLIIRLLLLLTFIGVTVYWGSIQFMLVRHKTSVAGFINDSGVQVEVAGRYLLLGKNPYTESYEYSDLAQVPFLDDAGGTKNPALFHNAYPPLMLVLSAVGFRIASQFLGFFDIRMVFLVFYTVLLLFGFVKFGLSERLLLFGILVAANPLFLNSMMQGSNDVIILAMLLWGLLFLERKHVFWSGICMGLAIAAKQTAWLIVPFLLFYAWQNRKKGLVKNFLLPMGAVSGFVYVPFIVWDGKALFGNLILYMSGSLPTSYPINNFGFGTALVAMGIVKTIYDYYPFWIWQGGFGFLYLVLFWRAHFRRIRVVHILTGYTTLLCIIWFFNRFMNFSYLAFILVMLAIAYLWDNKSVHLT